MKSIQLPGYTHSCNCLPPFRENMPQHDGKALTLPVLICVQHNPCTDSAQHTQKCVLWSSSDTQIVIDTKWCVVMLYRQSLCTQSLAYIVVSQYVVIQDIMHDDCCCCTVLLLNKFTTYITFSKFLNRKPFHSVGTRYQAMCAFQVINEFRL